MAKTTSRQLNFAPFSLDSAIDLLYRDGTIVPLEPNAVRVLRFLAENHERVVTKEELLENVWRDVFTTDDVLKKAVSQIRRAVGDSVQNPQFIETYHRRGYRFIAPVTPDGELPVERQTAASETETAAAALIENEIEAASNNGEPDFNRFVGRAVEMDILRGEFRRTMRGDGQPVLIVGDPGIGKTQLAGRFENWASRESAVCIRARFFDYDAARLLSYDLFLDLLGEALTKFSAAQNPVSSANKNQHAVYPSFKNVDLRAEVNERLGVTLPEELFPNAAGYQRTPSDAFRMIVPLADCFLRLSRERPLVIVLDDLQWADDASRKIIGYLMRNAARERLMIVALARREELNNPVHAVAQWVQTEAVYRSFSIVNLNALSEKDYRALIGEIFGEGLETAMIPADDLRLLYRTTGGNPYFLIETIRLLIAEGAIENAAPSSAAATAIWHWRGLRNVPLPETIRMAGRAKVSRLSRQTLDLVERAAVLGDSFQIETLERMFDTDAASESEIEFCLSEAVAAQVLSERDVSGADDCQFYHTTLRRAVYSDLSPRRRKRLHTRAARAVEIVHAADLERVAPALAAHAEAAGNAGASFEWSLRAAAAARLRFDWVEAADAAARAQRAAKMLDKNDAERLSDEKRLELMLLTSETLMSTGRRGEAEKLLGEAAEIAVKTNLPSFLADVRALEGHTRVLLGKYRESLESSQEALALSRDLNDREGIADAQLQIASAQYALCDYDAACETLQTVIAETAPTSYRHAVALGKLGWADALQSRYAEAKNLLERALVFHETAGDARQRIVLFLCLNWCEYGVGNYEAAIAFAAQAQAEALNLGESFSASVALMRIAKARLAEGLYAEGETILTQILTKSAVIAAKHHEAETRWMLGRAKCAAGKFAEADELYRGALEMIRSVGDREDEFRIISDIANLQIQRGSAAAGLESARQAAVIAAEINVSCGVGAALIEQAGAHLALGEIDAALAAVRQAVEILDAADSGERCRAYYVLANTLRAAAQSADSAKKKLSAAPFDWAGTEEAALRSALKILAARREQFAVSDAPRRAEFVRSHQPPARDLQNLLLKLNRREEAAEISREWQLDSAPI